MYVYVNENVFDCKIYYATGTRANQVYDVYCMDFVYELDYE